MSPPKGRRWSLHHVEGRPHLWGKYPTLPWMLSEQHAARNKLCPWCKTSGIPVLLERYWPSCSEGITFSSSTLDLDTACPFSILRIVRDIKEAVDNLFSTILEPSLKLSYLDFREMNKFAKELYLSPGAQLLTKWGILALRRTTFPRCRGSWKWDVPCSGMKTSPVHPLGIQEHPASLVRDLPICGFLAQDMLGIYPH